MKAPPKRKGNLRWLVRACSANLTLNESPSEKEGKFQNGPGTSAHYVPSMKVPPKRKGNWNFGPGEGNDSDASMKVPPKRKGNPSRISLALSLPCGLNESPSEKEGKAVADWFQLHNPDASMKVPPKRKGKATRK